MSDTLVRPFKRQYLSLPLRALLGVAFVVSVLFSTILMSLIVGYLGGEHIRSRVVREFGLLAFEMRDNVDRTLYERVSDIRLLTTSSVMTNPGVSPEQRRQRLEDLKKTIRDHIWIGFADASGRIVTGTDSTLEGSDLSGEAWFKEALRELSVSNFEQTSSGGQVPLVRVTAPVHAPNGSLIGVVISHINWAWAEEIGRQLLDSSANPSAEILIVDPDGRVLLGSEQRRTYKPPAALLPSAQDQSVTSIDTGDQLIALSQSRGYRDYPGFGWQIVVRQAAKEALQPVRLMQQQVLLWGSGIGLFFAVIGLALAEAIGRPLRKIAAAADRLRTGGDTQMEFPRSLVFSEIQLLSRSLTELFQQREKARREAEAASQARSDFLAAMSHEIRTPLTGVLGMADLLGAEDLPPKQKSYVDSIRVSGRHLLSVINDILDFSRIETGKLELEHIDFSLPEQLEHLRSLVQPLAIERGLELRFELSEHSPPILKGDPTRLKQVLLNLAGNAIKFTERGSVILHISHRPAEERRPRFRFEVRDTGIGIAPENQAELFTAFAQADRSTARRFGGSGLGLAISRRLVEAMGGEIGVTSLQGVGSVFWFELPFELGDPANLTRAATVQFTPVQPSRILVAEDVAINRDLLREVLSRQGHEVVFAENGAEAVALAEKGSFDLILMDVQMPVMDGIEATRRIRKLDGPVRDIPILALTANVMAHETEKYLAAGMTECLMKPIDWNQLTAALARYGREQVVAPSKAGARQKADETPLVSRPTLERFSAYMPAEQLAPLLKRGIEDAERSCEEMAGLPQGSDELAKKAHSLRGMAGLLGLSKISRIAAEIEERARSGRGIELQLSELKDVIEATRGSLRRSDFADQ